jgi:radical SAM-linked protein
VNAVRGSLREVSVSMKTPAAEMAAKSVLRVRFHRYGPAIWLAHLDLMRTFERSVRRAGIPVNWSAGFNPRPDLVFALPIGVGLETCADYLDMGLIDPIMQIELMITQLDQSLPEGLAILSGIVLPVSSESIMSKIVMADYQIEAEGLAIAATKTLLLSQLIIDKPSKGRTIRVDIRPLILMAETDSPNRMRLRVKAGSRENLRPDLFLNALCQFGELDTTAAADARLVRTGLYLSGTSADQTIADPEGVPMPAIPVGCP